jgi:3-oxoacyl-[acyl-carrier-protein] synthase II
MKRRVVITGMGVLTPIGNTVDEMWTSLLEGKCGIDKITLFDASKMKVQIAGEVKNLNPDEYLEPREYRKIDRTMLFGLIAASQAYKDANLEGADIDRDRFGTFVTSGIGGINTIKDEAIKAYEKGGDRVSPFFIPHSIINLVGGVIAIKFKAKGPNIPVVTACSAGTNAIGEAFRYIRDGYLDIAFAGGSEAPINELSIGGFASMRALNTSNDPSNASIPFDKNRSGFVVAEGCGVVILEEYDHAVKRGAKIYCEVIGYGSTCDAYHITAPDESAEGITKAIKLALQDANIAPDKIDYINPHGTSTPYNDRLETLGIKNALGRHAYDVNISATKSMTGHALGAIGAIEAIITAKSIYEGIVTPTINLRTPDEECDLNYTTNGPVKRDINYALSNSVGFGGQNATLVFKKYEERE